MWYYRDFSVLSACLSVKCSRRVWHNLLPHLSCVFFAYDSCHSHLFRCKLFHIFDCDISMIWPREWKCISRMWVAFNGREIRYLNASFPCPKKMCTIFSTQIGRMRNLFAWIDISKWLICEKNALHLVISDAQSSLQLRFTCKRQFDWLWVRYESCILNRTNWKITNK